MITQLTNIRYCTLTETQWLHSEISYLVVCPLHNGKSTGGRGLHSLLVICLQLYMLFFFKHATTFQSVCLGRREEGNVLPFGCYTLSKVEHPRGSLLLVLSMLSSPLRARKVRRAREDRALSFSSPLCLIGAGYLQCWKFPETIQSQHQGPGCIVWNLLQSRKLMSLGGIEGRPAF